MLAILVIGSASITVFSGLALMCYLPTLCIPTQPSNRITVELTPLPEEPFKSL